MYPGLSMGRRAGENSVAWRTDTWEMVKPGLVPIPYFNGRIRPMPYVLLQHKQTGVRAYFSTFHNPANIGGNMQRFRSEATRREINLFNQLEKEGIPQFVTGDMNERTEYFCRVTGSTPLISPAGGSNNGGCRPPPRPGIDWIFGSPGVQFTSYISRSQRVRTPQLGPPAPGQQGHRGRVEVQERLRPGGRHHTLIERPSGPEPLSGRGVASAPRRGSPPSAARAAASRARRSRRAPC